MTRCTVVAFRLGLAAAGVFTVIGLVQRFWLPKASNWVIGGVLLSIALAALPLLIADWRSGTIVHTMYRRRRYIFRRKENTFGYYSTMLLMTAFWLLLLLAGIGWAVVMRDSPR